MQDFFKKRGVAVMPVIDLFNFVVNQNIADEDVDAYLEKVSCMFEYRTLPFSLHCNHHLLKTHNDACMIDGNLIVNIVF